MEQILKGLKDGDQESFVPFLEDLHRNGRAASEHTTLLLNAYIRAKDESKLDKFVKDAGVKRLANDGLPEPEDPKTELDRSFTQPPRLDAPAAIYALRQAHYSAHAAALALKFEEHAAYVDIQIDDLGDHGEALSHLETLRPQECTTILSRCLRSLLESTVCEGTISLLALLCGGRYRPKVRAINLPTKSTSGLAPGPSRAKIYLNSFPLGRRAEPTESSLDTYVNDAVQAIQQATVPQYDLPTLSLFQASLTRFPEAHTRLLETVAELRHNIVLASQLTPPDDSGVKLRSESQTIDVAVVDGEQALLWDTLLELYLRSGSQIKALNLLRSEETVYDIEQALLVCIEARFQAGIVYVLEQKQQYIDLLRLCATIRTGDPLINACLAAATSTSVASPFLKALNRFGPLMPKLYVEALRLLVASPDLLTDIGDDAVLNIVEEIDRHKLLSFLEIVRELGRTKMISVGMIRGWLIDRLARDQDEQTTNEKLAESYQQSNLKLQARLQIFDDPKQPKIIQEDTCAQCEKRLDLPTVHFLCGHSFHQRCLDDDIRDCPIDYESLAQVRALRQTQKQVAADQDRFFYHLENAQDPKAAIIEHGFGRGLMSFVSNLDTTSV